MNILQADNVGLAFDEPPPDLPAPAHPRPPDNPAPTSYLALDQIEPVNIALLKTCARDYSSALLGFEAICKTLDEYKLHYPIETVGIPIFGAPDEGEHTYRIGWTQNPFDGTYTVPLYLYFAFYADDTQQIECHAEVADEVELAAILADEEDYDIPEVEDDDYEYTEVVDDPDQEEIPEDKIVHTVVTDEEP